MPWKEKYKEFWLDPGAKILRTQNTILEKPGGPVQVVQVWFKEYEEPMMVSPLPSVNLPTPDQLYSKIRELIIEVNKLKKESK